LVLEGEDSAGYDELLRRVYAAIEPVDVIEDIFIEDVVSLEWEVLRWRRLKFSLIRSHTHQALTKFLGDHLEYSRYREEFTEDLTEILENTLPEDRAKDVARKLAHHCAPGQADAFDRANEILAGQHNAEDLLNRARKEKAEELTQAYVRGDTDAVTLVHKYLDDAGECLDTLVVGELRGLSLEYIERIDRLTTIAESRRNSSLREIDRRRAVLGETVRRTVQEIERDDLKVIEATPAKGKNAA
jgi:hypothetical protein